MDKKKENNRLISKVKISRKSLRAALSFVLDQVLGASGATGLDKTYSTKVSSFMKQRFSRHSKIKDFWEVAKLSKAHTVGVFVQAKKQMIRKGEMLDGECLVNFQMASRPVRQPGWDAESAAWKWWKGWNFGVRNHKWLSVSQIGMHQKAPKSLC